MADENPPPSEPTAWDRVGQTLGDMAELGGRMSNRNMDLWRSVSGHLRSDRYEANDMTTDIAHSWMTAMDNLDDMWSFWTRASERDVVAADLPTAFLLFQATGREQIAGDEDPDEAEAGTPRKIPGYAVNDPVWIRIPVDVKNPPPHAEIELAGVSEEGASALKDCLSTTLGRAGSAYELVTGFPGKAVRLVPGAYSGVVYLPGSSPRALANLRVVVRKRRED
jgi:hypothetical protein